MVVYINPFTDFGFKKLFGEEASKHLLIDFLNALLPVSTKIVDLSFKNTEQLGQINTDRKAIFDIYCENEKGEKFIVELQKAKQNYFKERTVFYSTFPIKEQGELGDWNFNLKAVFCIGILDFIFDDFRNDEEKKLVIHEIKLKNQEGKTFYEKLTYIYLEMPNFNKTETELASRLDKWLYFIKNLKDLQQIPTIFKNEDIFKEAFNIAAIANYNKEEQANYEYSLKIYRDLKNVIDYAKEEGIEIGVEKGIDIGIERGQKLQQIKTAIACKKQGLSSDLISQLTGLRIEEIEKL